jgi:hypothetical protein
MPIVAMFTHDLSQETPKGFMHMKVAAIRATPHRNLADDSGRLLPEPVTKQR